MPLLAQWWSVSWVRQNAIEFAVKVLSVFSVSFVVGAKGTKRIFMTKFRNEEIVPQCGHLPKLMTKSALG